MTAILLRECCEECPDDPCSECGCGGKTGCLKPSESSTNAYRIVNSGKNSNSDCEYILQPIDPETGEDLPNAMHGIIPEQQVDENYVAIPCPEPPHDCGRGGQCATLKYSSWNSGFVYNSENIDDVCYYDLYASDGTVKGRYRENQLDFHDCCEYEYRWVDTNTMEAAEHLYVAYVDSWHNNKQTLKQHYYKWDAKNCAYYKVNDHDRERPFRYDPNHGGFKLTWLEDDGTTVVYERANEYPHKPPSYSTEVYKNDKTFWKHRASGGRMLLVSGMGVTGQVKIQETPVSGNIWGTHFPGEPETDQEIFLVNITSAIEAYGATVILGTSAPAAPGAPANFQTLGHYDSSNGNITLYIDAIKAKAPNNWEFQAMQTLTHEAIHAFQDWFAGRAVGDNTMSPLELGTDAAGIAEARKSFADPDNPINTDALALESEAYSNDDTLSDAQALLDNLRANMHHVTGDDYYDY